jgi:TPR repeat protein
LFLLTAGITEIIREIELDCPPYQNVSTETLRLRAAELKEEGDAAEQFNVGLALRYRGEIELGYRLVCLSAPQGFQDAQNWMARRYHFGFPPVEADLVQAYKWYQIAFYGADYADKKRAELSAKMTPAEIAEAERLVAEWQPNLAECDARSIQFARGTLTAKRTDFFVEEQYRLGMRALARKDDQRAKHHFCLSANEGHGDAQLQMGHLALERTELEEAFVWYSLAADSGASGGVPYYKQVASRMNPNHLANVQRLLAEWEPNPAECEVETTTTFSVRNSRRR